MDQTEKILSKIRDIAVKLNHDGAVYTRADLAYELKTCGIANDSIEVSRLVCEAFSRFGNDAIKTSFLTNDGKHTVVDAYMAAFVYISRGGLWVILYNTISQVGAM